MLFVGMGDLVGLSYCRVSSDCECFCLVGECDVVEGRSYESKWLKCCEKLSWAFLVFVD